MILFYVALGLLISSIILFAIYKDWVPAVSKILIVIFMVSLWFVIMIPLGWLLL